MKTKFSNWTDVIVRHLARFRRIALHLLGNIADAEDAVQDALLSAFTHLDQFRGQAKMSTWLTTIVINVAGMKLRRRSPQAQISLDEIHGEQNLLLAEMRPDDQPNPEEVCCRQDLAGLNISRTVHLLGVPGGTVKAQLARGRIRLKEIVRKGLRGNGDAIRSIAADSNPQKATEAQLRRPN